MEIRTRPGRRAGEPGARRSEGRIREGQGRPRVTGEGIPAPEQSSAPESPAGAAAQGAGGVGLGRAGAAVWEMPSCSPLTARGPPALHLPAPVPPSRYMGSTWPGRRSVACGLAPPPPCCRDSGQGRPSLHKADPVARRPSQPGHLRGQPDRLGARDGLRGAAAAWAQDHSPRPRPLGPVPSAPAGSTVLSRNSCTSALAPGSSWGSLPAPAAPHGVLVAKQVAMDASQRRWGGLLRSGGVVIARGVGVDSSDQRDRVRVLPSFEHPEASDGLCASVVCAAPCSAENAKKSNFRCMAKPSRKYSVPHGHRISTAHPSHSKPTADVRASSWYRTFCGFLRTCETHSHR
ncbi:A-kinase-interacting protein 1 isoform X1 [Sus scrofa]|uniref:A-kinase-interacting protein 1 isoform X1 n=1 Tax=Sus scrofa TaxID=9823 RepID=UPI000A2B7139|nr:A-kinase-interacting protein 1 isoform X1 [Sus scrofa]